MDKNEFFESEGISAEDITQAFMAGNFQPTIDFFNRNFVQSDRNEITMMRATERTIELFSRASADKLVEIAPKFDSIVIRICALKAATQIYTIQVAKSAVDSLFHQLLTCDEEDEEEEE